MVRFFRIHVPSDGTWVVSQSERPSNIEVPFERLTPSLARMKKNFLRKHGFTARVSVSLMGDLVALVLEPMTRRDFRNSLLLSGGVKAYNSLSLVFMPYHISLCDRKYMSDAEFDTLKEFFNGTELHVPVADVEGDGCIILGNTFPHFTTLEELYLRKYWWKSCKLHISG